MSRLVYFVCMTNLGNTERVTPGVENCDLSRDSGRESRDKRQRLTCSDAKRGAPSELSALLNHALDCLDELQKTARFSEPESVREAHQEFYATT